MLVTLEEERAQQTIKTVCDRLRRRCLAWDEADGFKLMAGEGQPPAARDPLTALEQVDKTEDNAVFVLKDFHELWQNAQLKRKLRNLAHSAKV